MRPPPGRDMGLGPKSSLLWDQPFAPPEDLTWARWGDACRAQNGAGREGGGQTKECGPKKGVYRKEVTR